MYFYVNHTHLDNCSVPSCYFTTAVLNDCYSEVMAYTALPYSYWASFYDAYICLRHAHYRYRLQLPYKSHRTYLTNRMGSISHHIMPLVTNSLEDGHTNIHTHTRKHTCIQTSADRSNSKKPGVLATGWFNTYVTTIKDNHVRNFREQGVDK